MSFDRDDVRVGLVVLLAAGLFGGLLFHRAFRALFTKERRVQVRLENVSDLAVGTEVLLQGLRVGQVKAIDLERSDVDYRFVATLGLRPDIVLWRGTRGIVTSKVLGGSYLDLALPPKAQRAVPLQAGDVLEGASSGSLAALIGEMEAFVRNLNGTLTELRGHVKAKGLGSLLEHPELRKVLGNLDGTLTEFRTLAREGQTLARHGDAAAQAATRDLERLETSLAALQELTCRRAGDLDAIVANLATVLGELKGLGTEARGLLKAGGPVEGSLEALQRDLRAAEELLELLKAKPNRLVWGTPSAAEKAAAKDRVEAARTGSR